MIQIRNEQSKFDKIFLKCMDNYYCDKGKIQNGTFFHYTSPDALNSILNGRHTLNTGTKEEEKESKSIALRFTKTDSLNDKAEGQAFLEIYQKTCRKLEKESVIDKTFFDFLKNIEDKDIFISFNEPFHFIKECDTYIFCLSEGKDLLPMWNYYSKNNQYEG